MSNLKNINNLWSAANTKWTTGIYLDYTDGLTALKHIIQSYDTYSEDEKQKIYKTLNSFFKKLKLEKIIT